MDGPMTVVVVDDEIPLRQELRAFPWESCDAVLVGEAENGEEALRICKDIAPDVVVTDITMPIMDGLTLIRELKQRYPHTQIILLTCHSEFQYAQEAIRLGALEYILKVSMEEEELKHALMKARQALVRDRNHWDNEEAKLRANRAKVLGKIICSAQDISSAAFHEYTSDWGPLELEGGQAYRLVQLMLDESAIEDYGLLHQDMLQIMQELERSSPLWATWLSKRNHEYFILFHQTVSPAVLHQAVEDMLDQLQSRLANSRSAEGKEFHKYVIISEAFQHIQELKVVLDVASAWKKAIFYDAHSRRMIFAGKPIELCEMSEEHKRKLEGDLRKLGRDTNEYISYFQGEFTVWCIKQRFIPDQLKKWMLQWQIDQLQDKEEVMRDEWDFEYISKAPTLTQLVNELVIFLSRLAGQEDTSRVEIRTAKQWIRDHLKDPINLTSIAEHAELSPQYLSRLFREEMGESVNQYITRLRMERAAELLKQTNMKVYEVAEEVGIPSYRYFTVTFRNWSGVAPTDYKK